MLLLTYITFWEKRKKFNIKVAIREFYLAGAASFLFMVTFFSFILLPASCMSRRHADCRGKEKGVTIARRRESFGILWSRFIKSKCFCNSGIEFMQDFFKENVQKTPDLDSFANKAYNSGLGNMYELNHLLHRNALQRSWMRRFLCCCQVTLNHRGDEWQPRLKQAASPPSHPLQILTLWYIGHWKTERALK